MATAQELAANPDGYVMPGTIVTTVINFFLIAVAVYFAIVMPMNTIKERMAKQKAEEEAKEVTDVELLTEIRDLLSAIPSIDVRSSFPAFRRAATRYLRAQPQCGGTSRLRRESLEPAAPVSGASSPPPWPLRASCS